ncbi:hypothetical protein AS9A_P20116 (plasmid) [Hoyosella subflava DQS3-9A1]|uniref:Uncharacterized protein n=1 Tax=Hoyosella subflava (strain DSM 45089 / JCM 17490 / NBRC 109087 / DQS3-9A1) TaxID=443218 RepID=F6ESN9_HOYSD|nr:hypothetical protein AS9A_P20116 [Hoyosella subflava DQS3-9A1]
MSQLSTPTGLVDPPTRGGLLYFITQFDHYVGIPVRDSG